MLGHAPWARLSPSGPAILLLAFCAVLTTQDICSSPGLQEHGGNDQTPVLYLNASSAQEGETVLVQCTIDEQFPATRVFFCKNGQEEFSLKAQHGSVNYSLVLTITSRSAGIYTCGYQQRNKENWVRNSALSAPQTLSVPGAGAGETTQDIHSSTGLLVFPVCSRKQDMSSASPQHLGLSKNGVQGTHRVFMSPTGSSPSHKAQLPSRGSAMPLEVWILHSALSLLLLLSAPIITLLLERCSQGASVARQPGDVPVPMEL